MRSVPSAKDVQWMRGRPVGGQRGSRRTTAYSGRRYAPPLTLGVRGRRKVAVLQEEALGLRRGEAVIVPYDTRWPRLFAEEYARLKLDLARRFHRDRPSYIDGKTEFVKSVLARQGMT